MKSLILFGIFACIATGAAARSCSLADRIRDDFEVAVAGFAACVAAEIRDLKRANEQLRRRVAELEAAVGDLPVRYVNTDGQIDYEEGREVGSASFVLSARQTGGISSLPLEHSVVTELCGKGDGCSISLILRATGFRSTEPIETVLSGPCLYTYEPDTGVWKTGEGCGVHSPASGVDGDGSAVGQSASGSIVLDSGQACLVADADASTRVAATDLLREDRAQGLYLIAVPSRRGTASRRFTCEFVIE